MTKRSKRKRVFKGPNTPITFRSAADPNSPMGMVTAEDGARVRAYPYLLAFVRPFVPGEFENHRVVSLERMEVVTHVLVARLDLTTIARTRLPITAEQAEMFEAFGVLEKKEAQADASYGPFTLPEETHRLTVAVASNGVHASFQDYPHLEHSRAVLESRAKQIAEWRVRAWNDISNDREVYVRLFIPAFVLGYRLGQEMFQETSVDEQTNVLQRVCSMGVPAAYHFIAQILQDRMNEMKADSIYKLL